MIEAIKTHGLFILKGMSIYSGVGLTLSAILFVIWVITETEIGEAVFGFGVILAICWALGHLW